MKTIEIDRKSWRYKIAVHPIPFLRERFEPRDRCSFRWMFFTGLMFRMLADLLIVVSGGVILYGLTIVLFTTIHNFGMSMDIPFAKFLSSLFDAYTNSIRDAMLFFKIEDEALITGMGDNTIMNYLIVVYYIMMTILVLVVPTFFGLIASIGIALVIFLSVVGLIAFVCSLIVDKASETKPAEVIGGFNHDIKEKFCAYVKYKN